MLTPMYSNPNPANFFLFPVFQALGRTVTHPFSSGVILSPLLNSSNRPVFQPQLDIKITNYSNAVTFLIMAVNPPVLPETLAPKTAAKGLKWLTF